MMNLRNWLIIFLLSYTSFLQGQIEVVKVKGFNEHLRGLGVLNDSVVWVSGTNGSYAFTEDGINFSVGNVSEAAGLDFRDVEVLNDSSVLLMTAGSPALIFKTTDKGESWNEVYRDERPEIFLDGMDFWNQQSGCVYGDPISNCFIMVCTNDGGSTWDTLQNLPVPMEKEAGFAASGTGIVTINDSIIAVATGGGEVPRLLYSSNKGNNWETSKVPMISGEGAGIFSIDLLSTGFAIAVGGNYMDSTSVIGNCAYSWDYGKTWSPAEISKPNGYRSGVSCSELNDMCIAVGRTGVDRTIELTNEQKTWENISKTGYYAVSFGDDVVWFSGRSGRIGRMKLE